MIDKRPRMLASCTTAADVASALDRARADELAVAVRSGGHAVAGQSSNNDGLVVDVRPMKTISIDPAARAARVGAGCTWGEFDGAAQVHGLATTGGRVSTTGVSGLTLGGGSGWLERQHGLSCDNLLAVELVTADGREVHADERQPQRRLAGLVPPPQRPSLRAVYEELAADRAGAVRNLLSYLGLPPPPGHKIVARDRRQADQTNADWIARYRATVTPIA